MKTPVKVSFDIRVPLKILLSLKQRLNGLVGTVFWGKSLFSHWFVIVVVQVLKRLKILLGPSPSRHIVL